jgi:arylsulfatase A-like enzyme
MRCHPVYLLLFLWASWIEHAPAEEVSGKRPNLLFILVDDQAPQDLRMYNPQSTLQTPHLDKLASQGVVFDGAYHMGSFSGAVCMPSRHMIMSGRTVWHLPPAPWGTRTSPPKLEQQTIPAVFNRAGYATMRTCKVGNSYEAANKLFTVRRDATKRGPTAETGSAWHAEQVLDYLHERESAKDARPFLIYFGLSHPHDERDGTPELLAKYGATNHTDEANPPSLHSLQPPLPKNYLERHPFENTDLNVRDEVAVSGVWKRRDEASIRNEIGRQYACSENIDIQIGRVLERLEKMGELANTYIFYTSDHGIAIGRHGLMGKQNLYQHTWRVPLIVKGPSIPAGRRVEGNIYLLDVLATLCDLSGVTPPTTNEGMSFKPVLTGERERLRDVLYGVYAGGAKPGMRAVKRGDWKLIQYESADGKTKHVQLFNLAENPDELLPEHGHPNLANDPRYAEKLAEMKRLLLEEMRRHEDPWRFSDQPSDDLPQPPQPTKRKMPKKV